MRITFIFVAMAIFWLPRVAHATEFDSSAISCLPSDANINNNTYVMSSNSVTHKTGVTGTIQFYCPIVTNISAPSHVYFLYSISSCARGNSVSAHYMKMNKSTGAVAEVANAFATTGTGAVVSTTANFSDVYDPTSYVYYVRIDLTRTSTSCTMAAYGVTVW